MLDEEVSGSVVDHSVKGIGVEGQGVVIVKPIDLYIVQTHLIIGKDSVGVHTVLGYHWDQG